MEPKSLEQLAADVEEMKFSNSALAVKVGELESRLSAVESSNAILKAEVSAMQADLNAPNTPNVASASDVADVRAGVAELRSGLNYIVYGIGSPHPDPREQGEPVE